VDPYTYSKEDLQKIASDMHKVAEATYWLFFIQGMGSNCHAFLEFNGLIAKYVDIARKAADAGIDFTQANIHNKTPLPVETHDLEYLAEKLECIFGPILESNPEAKRAFLKKLFPNDVHAYSAGGGT
jgi:N-acetyl-anhydromuramyl-L-alanine amidase AmpD